MKSQVLTCVLASVATLGFTMTAFGHDRGHEEGKVTSILYSCNMDFRATGKSIYIGLGWTDIHGKGTISCYDLLHGTTEILPIKVKVKGPGAGLGVTGLVLSGVAAGVGVEKGPENLLGRYVAVRGNAAVGVGAGVAVGLRVSKGGINVDVSVQAESGLGAGIDLLSLKIEPDGDMRRESPMPAPAVQAADNDEAPLQRLAPTQAAAVAAPTIAPAAFPSGTTAIAISEEKTTVEKANIVYLQEDQPLQIIDGKGKVIQTIYLKSQR